MRNRILAMEMSSNVKGFLRINPAHPVIKIIIAMIIKAETLFKTYPATYFPKFPVLLITVCLVLLTDYCPLVTSHLIFSPNWFDCHPILTLFASKRERCPDHSIFHKHRPDAP